MMKILFQGDSITDGNKDHQDPHDLGNSYPKYAAAMISDSFPKTEFEFLNLGFSGNRSGQLLERLERDLIDIQPDIVSILIGINDVWHRRMGTYTSDESFAENLEKILSETKKRTNAKILLMTPFLLDAPDKEEMREEVNRAIEIVNRLGERYADTVLHLDKIFASALPLQPTAHFYSNDGVHPNAEGSCFVGEQYLHAITPLIESLSDRSAT